MRRDTTSVAAETSNLQKVREFMSRLVKASSLPERDGNKVVLAVDEAIANIVKHAYSQKGSGEVELEVRFDAEKFEVLIRDDGQAFDPNAIKSPDMAEHVRMGRKTGLGIFLMRQIMDEVKYSFKDGEKNRLHLVKFIKPAAGGVRPDGRDRYRVSRDFRHCRSLSECLSAIRWP